MYNPSLGSPPFNILSMSSLFDLAAISQRSKSTDAVLFTMGEPSIFLKLARSWFPFQNGLAANICIRALNAIIVRLSIRPLSLSLIYVSGISGLCKTSSNCLITKLTQSSKLLLGNCSSSLLKLISSSVSGISTTGPYWRIR